MYSHGHPTDDVYTINFKSLKMYITAMLATTNDDGITAIMFFALWHDLQLTCTYGPIGEKTGDFQIRVGAASSSYGSVSEQGITTLGFNGCLPPT